MYKTVTSIEAHNCQERHLGLGIVIGSGAEEPYKNIENTSTLFVRPMNTNDDENGDDCTPNSLLILTIAIGWGRWISSRMDRHRGEAIQYNTN